MFQLSLQMEVQNDKTAVADSDLRADVERWHKNKRRDLRELFVAFADRNIRYYEKVYWLDFLFFKVHLALLI